MPAGSGNVRCPDCGGRGGIRTPNGWAVCSCVRGSQLTRDLQHRTYAPRDHDCEQCRRAQAYLDGLYTPDTAA